MKILRYSLVGGSIVAVVCFAFFLIMYFISKNPLGSRRVDIGFNIIFIFVTIFYFKKKNGGYLQFHEGFSIGFLTNLWAAFLTGISLFFFIEFIDYSPFETWLSEGKQLLIKQKDALKKVLNEDMHQAQLQAFDNAKSYQIILDELMFKQLAIVAVTLTAMALRRNREDT